MSLLDSRITLIDGTSTTLGDLLEGRAALLVNVASNCGLTSQYAGLEQLHEKYTKEGFSVVGFPCNQFGGQEPGTSEEIAEFCSSTYGVTFPLTEKIEVNGEDAHEIYQELVDVPDENGDAGDIRWNFEKFLVTRDGTVVARFSPGVQPEDPQLLGVLDAMI